MSPSHEQKQQDKGVVTAYTNFIPQAQKQSLPGLDADMSPLAEHTKVETWNEEGKPQLEEYQGNGRLVGKNAIITGGDSGIGRAAALAFAREGASVTITYLPEEQKDAEEVQRAAAAGAAHGKEGTVQTQVHIVPLDLRKREDSEKVVQEHLKKWCGGAGGKERIDILVNNASEQHMTPDVAELDLDLAERTLQTNVLGMMTLTKFALPYMTRGGSIINTTSVTAFRGSKGMVPYSATKGAIATFTRSLAMQLAPKGIRVNAVAPGPVYTPLQPASRPEDNMEEWGVGDVPLHGRPAQPAECAGTYVYLADARQSNIMTGQTMHINQGSWYGS